MSVVTRYRGKSILLTYPQCDLDLEDMKARLIRIIEEKDNRIVYGIICSEKHQSGILHRHVFMQLENVLKLGKKNMDTFDLQADNRSHWAVDDMGMSELIIPNNLENNKYHPNIKNVKSPKDAIRYVKKHGEYITWGICPYKMEISTKEKNELLKGKTLLQLVEDGDVSIFKIPQLQKARQILQNELLPMEKKTLQVFWYYGKTGSGKSFKAREEAYKDRPTTTNQGDHCWIMPISSTTNTTWFDGYNGQPIVIIDDIRSNTISFTTLLLITQEYRDIKVPIKGGFVNWYPERIYITAPAKPGKVYCRHGPDGQREEFDGIDQLLRRITECRKFYIENNERKNKIVHLI